MQGFRWSLGTLVAGVTAFMAISGWGPRLETDQYESVALNAEAHAQINSYIGPMQAYARVFKRPSKPTPEEVIHIANLWISSHAVGKLKDIGRTVAEDSCQDGVKSQIIDARDAIACQLREQARTHAANRNWSEAAACYRQALRVLEIMKYAEVSTLSASYGYQNQILRYAQALPPEVGRLVQWTTPEDVPSEIRRLTRVEVIMDEGIGRGGKVVESKYIAATLQHLKALSPDVKSILSCVRAVSDSSVFPARPGLHVRLAVQRWYEQERLRDHLRGEPLSEDPSVTLATARHLSSVTLARR